MDIIKNKYKSVSILKSKDGKIIQKVNPLLGTQSLILKSYPLNDAKSMQNQLQVYQTIKQPHLHGFSEIKQGFKYQGRLYLAFDQLGSNIQQLRVLCGGRFSLKTTLMIGLQMLQRIQYIHQNGFLHGDIKPSNFLIGKNQKVKHKIYLVDFELSQPYILKGKHIDQKSIQHFSGSLRFCGIGPNNYKNMCRRDQIISWIYCLIFFLKGELPWMTVKANNMLQAYNLICAIKMQKQTQLLQGLPQTFNNIFKYALSLKFKDKPNYGYLKQQLLTLMKKNGYQLDYKHDWEYI